MRNGIGLRLRHHNPVGYLPVSVLQWSYGVPCLQDLIKLHFQKNKLHVLSRKQSLWGLGFVLVNDVFEVDLFLFFERGL